MLKRHEKYISGVCISGVNTRLASVLKTHEATEEHDGVADTLKYISGVCISGLKTHEATEEHDEADYSEVYIWCMYIWFKDARGNRGT